MTKRPDTHVSLTAEKVSRENASSGRDIPRKTVVGLCAGEHEAFNEIFRSYHASIKNSLRYYCALSMTLKISRKGCS